MMKAYKVTLLIIDHDELGPECIIEEIQDAHYANHCIHPVVRAIEGRDISEWNNDHPLNHSATADAEYKRLFGPELKRETEQDLPLT